MNQEYSKNMIAFTRFSCLTRQNQRAFRVGQANDFDTYCKIILEEARLKERLDLFINYQLPSMNRASMKYNYMHVVFTTTLLPFFAKEALVLAAKRYRWLYIIFLNPDDRIDTKIFHECIEENKEFKNNLTMHNYIAVFRIDDDDIVNDLYFDQLYTYLNQRYSEMAISLCCGYKGLFNDSKYVMFSREVCPFTGCGLAYNAIYKLGHGFSSKYIEPPGQHRKIHTIVPTICDAVVPCYIRTIKLTNDTSYIENISNIQRKTDLDLLIEKHFKTTTDPTEVYEYFPIVKIDEGSHG